MAAPATTTSSSSATIAMQVLGGLPGRIGTLWALRSGVQAMVDHLARVAEAASDDPADALTHKVEKAFMKALDELAALDREIMALPATSLDELKIQAALMRLQTDDGSVWHGGLDRLFDSIEAFRG